MIIPAITSGRYGRHDVAKRIPIHMAGSVQLDRPCLMGLPLWHIRRHGPRCGPCPLPLCELALYSAAKPLLSRLITRMRLGSTSSFGLVHLSVAPPAHEGELWGNFGALLRRVLLGRACPCRRSAQVEVHAFTRGLEINGSDEKEG